MRMRAVWLLGLLASVILGSLVGLSLWQAGLGGAVWGVAAGALTFACFRPWPSVANASIGTDPGSYCFKQRCRGPGKGDGANALRGRSSWPPGRRPGGKSCPSIIGYRALV
jgi:hypothetical protein